MSTHTHAEPTETQKRAAYEHCNCAVCVIEKNPRCRLGEAHLLGQLLGEARAAQQILGLQQDVQITLSAFKTEEAENERLRIYLRTINSAQVEVASLKELIDRQRIALLWAHRLCHFDEESLVVKAIRSSPDSIRAEVEAREKNSKIRDEAAELLIALATKSAWGDGKITRKEVEYARDVYRRATSQAGRGKE